MSLLIKMYMIIKYNVILLNNELHDELQGLMGHIDCVGFHRDWK